MAKDQTTSVEGLFLDPLTQKWLISKKIGTGACGSVYNLVRNRTSSKTANGTTRPTTTTTTTTEYAVKVAKLPPPSTNMKRKKTLLEMNADLLNHEHVLYRNVLNNLRGTMVPEIPFPGSKGPNGFGEISGYRYLVMEKMESPLCSIIPMIVNDHVVDTPIDFGPIAERFVRLMEALHDAQLVFVDVKPENFMLAPSCSTGGQSSQKKGKNMGSNVKAVADRLRMIDFGLVESFRDAVRGKHRLDMFPNGQLVGTPSYASLNVLSGHTVGRRDDLEACFYVLVELVLQIVAYKNDCNSSSTRSSNAQRRIDIQTDLLPWSNAKSDEEIIRLKEDAMSDHGVIWKLLANHGNEALSLEMKEIYGLIRSLDYKQKPNYDELASLLGRLKIKVGGATTIRKSKAKRQGGSDATAESLKRGSTTPTISKRDTKRMLRTAASGASSGQTSSPLYDEDVMPISVVASTRATRAAARAAAKNTPSSTRKRRHLNDIQDVEMKSAANKSDEESVIMVETRGGNHDNDADTMDWELVTNENKAFISNVDESHNTSKEESIDKPHLYLECINGPHVGESFLLTDTLVLGSDPSKTKGKNTSTAIIKDTCVSANHARLVLNQTGTKKTCILMVKVYDLNSENGTLINGKMLPKGSSRQAFVKDQIKVGTCTFRISKSAGSM